MQKYIITKKKLSMQKYFIVLMHGVPDQFFVSLVHNDINLSSTLYFSLEESTSQAAASPQTQCTEASIFSFLNRN